jgi:4-amino-4-deoxy-L-arabinose transferase-like glycosyltransferase
MPEHALKVRWLVNACVVALLAILYLELALTARIQSMTVDEGNHTYSGYLSWKRFDFGLNPEHPPLVKLLATLPLLAMPINAPPPGEIYYKLDAYIGGRKLLSGSDKETILFRARLAVALLPVLLAALVFFMTREMFGAGAGLLALTLAVFDPNLIGHGALVTTDTGISCFLLGAVYMFYRYVKEPSAFRLIAAGVMAGLALASKHSGMFLFLILPALVVCELVRAFATRQLPSGNLWNRFLKLSAALALILLISVGTLWAFYGFRYSARPSGLVLHPPLEVEVKPLKPAEAKAVLAVAHWKLLPESYLFGAADVRRVGEGYSSFLLGKIHRHGVWFYFPIVLTIKATEALLFLALLTLVAVFARRLWATREFIFLAVPPAIFLAIAMSAT